MSKHSSNNNNIGCGTWVLGIFILLMIVNGVQQCSNSMFGGNNSKPKTHKVAKKPKKKKLKISVYNQNWYPKEQIVLSKNQTSTINNCKCTILKAYRLPLKSEEGWVPNNNHSVTYMTKQLLRVWIKVQVPVQYDAQIGTPTLTNNGQTVKTFIGDEFGKTVNTEQYANQEMLFGVPEGSDKSAVINVPVSATKDDQTKLNFNWQIKFNLN